jgi:pyridoxine 5-phosphate synthase
MISHGRKIKLGVNIDHVATLRQARGGKEPSVLEGALQAIQGGADGITIHLREDRRHIQDQDVFAIHKKIKVPLNLEMSVANDIVNIACRARPGKACLVPEKRQELTTEGGLDVVGAKSRIHDVVRKLQDHGILVSLFIDPIRKQIEAARDIQADFIELHTGSYANRTGYRQTRELRRLKEAAKLAHSFGMGVNAGHGLNYQNVKPVARILHLHELNIGHSIVARSVSTGLARAVQKMRQLIKKA